MTRSRHRQSTILRIDPALPLIWESASILRFGFDQAEARITSPSSEVQRLIEMLVKGATSRELGRAAKAMGEHPDELQLLLDNLSSVLVREPQLAQPAPKQKPTVAIFGSEQLNYHLEHAVKRAGFALAEPTEPPSFALLTDRYVVRAERAHDLLAAEIPHISIGMSDRSAWLGPIVPPQGAPCLTCAELQAETMNSLHKRLSAQILVNARELGSLSCHEALSTLAVVAVENWLQGSDDLVGSILRFEMQDGLLSPLHTIERVLPHHDCGCVALAPLQSMAA